MTEESSGTLFCVDWLGCPIMDGEGLGFMDELVAEVVEDDVLVDRLHEFHSARHVLVSVRRRREGPGRDGPANHAPPPHDHCARSWAGDPS